MVPKQRLLSFLRYPNVLLLNALQVQLHNVLEKVLLVVLQTYPTLSLHNLNGGS